MKNKLRIFILLTMIFGILNSNLNAQESSVVGTKTEVIKNNSKIADVLRKHKTVVTIASATLLASVVGVVGIYNREKIRNLFTSKPKVESEEERKLRLEQEALTQKKKDKEQKRLLKIARKQEEYKQAQAQKKAEEEAKEQARLAEQKRIEKEAVEHAEAKEREKAVLAEAAEKSKNEPGSRYAKNRKKREKKKLKQQNSENQ